MASAVLTELDIDGMTCAACASRIQDELSSLEHVRAASVNFATARASVSHDGEVSESTLAATVHSLGYSVVDRSDPSIGPTREDRLRRRLVVAALLTVPAVALSMIMSLRFSGWEWVVAGLTTPVVLWAGWPFHAGAWSAARHRAANMDTLVSLGSLAALGWSVVALVSGVGDAEVYFELA